MEHNGIICNNSTNKFETMVGMLNIAPTKISGQYKLVYDKDLKPWLDDYTGRRVAVDTSISFLEQVANFLSITTFLSDTECLRFGGFQKNTTKSWHIPFYFGSQLEIKNYPKYFVLSQVPNETFDEKYFDNIYKFGVLVKVVDLESIGLYNILNEIQSEPYFNYPLYFNHLEQKVQLFGYGIEEQYPVQHTLNLAKIYSNQAYIDVLNNKILNTFVNNKIFFPRFLNIEFEFEFDKPTEQDFNNFYGYLSNVEIIDKELLPSKNEEHNGYFIKTKINKFIYSNEEQVSDYVLDGLITDKNTRKDKFNNLLKLYQLETGNGSVNEIYERLPQVRFKISHLNIGNIIQIIKDNDILFEYQIDYDDYNQFDSLYSMVTYLCKKMTKLSNHDFEFSCKLLSSGEVIITVISNIENSIYDINTKIILPFQAQTVDDDFVFRGIGQNDVWLCGNLLPSEKYLFINNIEYQVIEIFKFNDYLVCRLVQRNEINYWESKEYDRLTPVQVKKVTTAFIYETKEEQLLKLEPINFLNYYTNLESETINNFQQYILSLKQKFGPDKIEENQDTYFTRALSNFAGINYNDIDDNQKIDYKNKILNQYVKLNPLTKRLEDSDTIEVDYHNEEIVKNILFNTIGCNGFITPNVLNIDRQFWIQNGCLSVSKQTADTLRYTWFLIAGEQPSYMVGKNWRYMDYIKDENGKKTYRPRITSRLVKITNNLCETIFLGVKYQLPIQYENWQFAVYLNFNEPEYLNIPEYFAEVYPEEKLILLSINKYIDFSDLIRGGNQSNEPILDLSFFNNIKTSYNECSDYYVDFSIDNELIGKKDIILEPFYNDTTSTILFNGNFVKDWIQDIESHDKFGNIKNIRYFCAQGENLTNIFKIGENKSIYITAKVTYNGKEYTYNSMKLTFESIKEVHDNCFWFHDLKVTFFDTRNIFLTKYKQFENIEEIIQVEFDNVNKTNIILPYQPVSEDSLYSDYQQIVTIVEDSSHKQFELLLPSDINDKTGERVSRPISLLNDWFRVSKLIEENKIDGSKVTTFEFDPAINDKNQNYLFGLRDELLFDISTYSNSYDLFDRNQIWKIVQDMLATRVQFKEYTEKQMYQELYKFSLDNFLALPNKSIKIKNSKFDEFSDNYIVVNAFDTDSNYVIWNVENDNKIVKINRHNSYCLPLLILQPNIEKFQINKYQVNNSLFNLYDKAFGGYVENTNIPISGTTLWEEVHGNLISTLFTKFDTIQLSTQYPTNHLTPINYFELLKKVIEYDKVIVTSDNHAYIETLNKNLKPYIIETYAKMLLFKYYTLYSVTDDEGLRIPYTLDNQNPYTIYVPNKNNLGIKYQNIKNIKFNLVRNGSN